MKIDFEILQRYLRGKEKTGDRDTLINWFSDFGSEKDLREKFHLVWDDLTAYRELEDCDGSAILGRIYHKMKKDEFRRVPEKKGMKRFIHVLQKVAAILFIPLVTYLLITKEGDFQAATEAAYSEIYCPLGTRTRFFLPDGSSGWLNGGSYLRFATEFKGKFREVNLEGEACFDVATNAKKPFVVTGTHTRVTAYGTSFNVETYPDDPETRITLVSGKVSVLENVSNKNLHLAELKPGQMCVYQPYNEIVRVETVDTQKVTGWTEGKLVFRNESFPTIIRKINRWYNVDLRIMDEELRSFSYQATFVDETLDEVLKLLRHSAPIKYKDMGKERRPDGAYEKRKIELYYRP